QRLARQLDRLGVDVIEAGFPIASDGDFTAVRSIAAEIRRPVICGLARAVPQDIQRAWEALKDAARPRIHVFLATSDIHLQYKLKISREKCLEQAREAVRLARSLCPDVEFSPEDATRTDIDFLCQVLNAVVDAGATTLNIPDTVGFTVPADFGALIRTIVQRVRGVNNGVVISAHCHNDLGLAVANSLAAVEAGARQVECAINGIGERAGNAALEELVMAFRVRSDQYPYDTAVVSEQLYPTSQMLCEVTGVGVQPNKAIIGRNAFAHAAGIHQDGMIKNPLTYEIITPQSVGVPDSTLVLGKHSGRHALAQRLEKLGYQFDRRELDDIYRRFVLLADSIKRVEDQHLIELARAVRPAAGAPALENFPKPFPAPVSADAALGISRAQEHHGEQEDYLWGV
ncbi:MAG TPA: 2-isopropylmalate synthase, partial [Terriglobales bacterium]